MTTSPSSGLSPEAKEFVPLAQNRTPNIPLYIGENTVASIYPSDQQPLVIESIYPIMLTNSKIPDNLQFPEIEFHIQPSQQQQFHIDSCSNVQQQSSTSVNLSSSNTSQIVLLPTTNPTTTVTPSEYYPGTHLIYSTSEHVSAFYPIDYCEASLINFPIQHPTQTTKSHRISSQQQISTSFRQRHGASHSTYRPSSRGGNRIISHSNNRNSYYDYGNRRNYPSFTKNTSRGSSTNSKRISSSQHQHDYSKCHHTSSRSRGYFSRSSQQHDERRKDHFNHYSHEKYYLENHSQQSSLISDDGTPFEFRPEDFPSLPINNQQSDETPLSSVISTNSKAASSWNAIVSATRPHSISPHSVLSSQDQRSDRSHSYNNKLSSNNERKSSKKNQTLSTAIKRANHASNNNLLEKQSSQPLNRNDNSISENKIKRNDIKEDDFMQTKQQHRRLKRKNKMKENSAPPAEQSNTVESASCVLDNENTFPTLGQQIAASITDQKSENGSTQLPIHKSNESHQLCLNDMFDALSTSTHVKQQNFRRKTSAITKTDAANSFDSKSISKRSKEREQPKSRKSTKLKRSVTKETEENSNQTQEESLLHFTVTKQCNEQDVQDETDTKTTDTIEVDNQDLNPLSSRSNNSSDTSDYDDAVENFYDE